MSLWKCVWHCCRLLPLPAIFTYINWLTNRSLIQTTMGRSAEKVAVNRIAWNKLPLHTLPPSPINYIYIGRGGSCRDLFVCQELVQSYQTTCEIINPCTHSNLPSLHWYIATVQLYINEAHNNTCISFEQYIHKPCSPISDNQQLPYLT